MTFKYISVCVIQKVLGYVTFRHSDIGGMGSGKKVWHIVGVCMCHSGVGSFVLYVLVSVVGVGCMVVHIWVMGVVRGVIVWACRGMVVG